MWLVALPPTPCYCLLHRRGPGPRNVKEPAWGCHLTHGRACLLEPDLSVLIFLFGEYCAVFFCKRIRIIKFIGYIRIKGFNSDFISSEFLTSGFKDWVGLAASCMRGWGEDTRKLVVPSEKSTFQGVERCFCSVGGMLFTGPFPSHYVKRLQGRGQKIWVLYCTKHCLQTLVENELLKLSKCQTFYWSILAPPIPSPGLWRLFLCAKRWLSQTADRMLPFIERSWERASLGWLLLWLGRYWLSISSGQGPENDQFLGKWAVIITRPSLEACSLSWQSFWV